VNLHTTDNRPTAAIFSDPRMLIGDRWLAEGGGGRFEQIDPSTGQVLGSLPKASLAEAAEAVAAAQAAAPAWRKLRVEQRRDILLRAAGLFAPLGEEFGVIASRESGHIFNPRGAAATINYLNYYAGWIDKIEGSTIPIPGADAFNFTEYEPYGVVLALATWNAPLATTIMKAAAALAAGNCIVLKPSELGSFAPLRFAEVMREAGLPAGVFNVVTGGPEIGAALVADPRVRKISFTGGLRTARAVLAGAAQNVVPVTMELGGKSANIIFADADLDKASGMAAMMGCISAAGQGCLYPTRLLVEDSIYEAVVERVLAVVATAKVGDPFTPGVTMGPVINEAGCNRVMGVIETAKAEKHGQLLTGGNRVGGALAKGYFIEPTVFGDVDNRSFLAQQEVFGPVLSIMRFASEEQAISMANDTAYGLAAYVHTRDISRALRVSRAMEAGYVGVNGFPPLPVTAPFGGYKQSGYGREHGRAGILEFLQLKNVYVAS
jgi:aldehyde dehydrogenase (NAD+)